jgi:predicted SAM-dependent methyltransferase
MIATKYLNLGCGTRVHPAWINVDLRPSAPGVLVHNLREDIPFPNETFDVVYHSHILEHFPRQLGSQFMKECFRVLKTDGIVRVVVPDLESIMKHYLTALERSRNGDKEAQANYEWLILELYDQTVRETSGGEMANYLLRKSVSNEAFVRHRIGSEAHTLIERRKTLQASRLDQPLPEYSLSSHSLTYFARRLYLFLIRLLLGKSRFKALQVGLFRNTGEVHHWMYDEYSLSLLLVKSGFANPMRKTGLSSSILNWNDFSLDADVNGSLYKPDSLYMEAFKRSI